MTEPRLEEDPGADPDACSGDDPAAAGDGAAPATVPAADRVAPEPAPGTTIEGLPLGVPQALPPEALTVDRIVTWIVCGVLLGSALLGEWVLLSIQRLPAIVPLLGGVAVAVLAMVLIPVAVWIPALEHARLRFTIDPLGLSIDRGIWWRSKIHVPRSRVQHTDVSQGPLQRRYGVATLTVYTAGSEYNSVAVEGLPHPLALRLRGYLLEGGDDF